MEFHAQITELASYWKYLCIKLIEIALNTCRNTPDFMCDLELFSKIRSHLMIALKMKH